MTVPFNAENRADAFNEGSRGNMGSSYAQNPGPADYFKNAAESYKSANSSVHDTGYVKMSETAASLGSQFSGSGSSQEPATASQRKPKSPSATDSHSMRYNNSVLGSLATGGHKGFPSQGFYG